MLHFSVNKVEASLH